MSFFYGLSRSSLRLLFWLLYRHQTILPPEGCIKRHPTQGAILAANHASFLDPPLIAASWPEPIHFLARQSLFHKPLLRAIITRLNAHPLGGKNDVSSLKLACQLLQEGKTVLVFPEGTRTLDGQVGAFKNGITLLAKKSGCPVIPAYIHGSFDLWPRKQSHPSLWGHRTACVFGSPLYFEEHPEVFAERVQQEIMQLRKTVVSQ